MLFPTPSRALGVSSASRLLRASAIALAACAATSSHALPFTTVSATFACQNTTCDAEIWLPQGVTKPPVIVMAHGFGALKDWGLQPFAQRFVDAGFAVVRFDYRGFGKSGGQPRFVVDGKEHVRDWLAVVDAVKVRTDVDGNRLGIWGSSFSGGQVLVVGSERPGVVKAVSSQVPFVNGFQSAMQFPFKYQPLTLWYGLRDALRGDKEEPLYIPIIAKDQFAALICPECLEGYAKLAPKGAETPNKVAARVFTTLPLWFPGHVTDRIEAPTLIVAAENDGLIPVSGVRDAAAKLKKGEYLELKGADHFSPYTGPVFEQVVARQTAFFKKNLMGQ